MNAPGSLILIRGGGDLASGVALRLQRAHYKVVITEVAQPLAVRRAVSFAEAIYQGTWEIEGVVAEYLADEKNIKQTLEKDHIPVVVDPEATIRNQLAPSAIIDGRMLKRPSELKLNAAPFVIGLGPGFTVGEDCHAVVETKRGHYLGRVYWDGSAQANTGIPDTVAGYDVQRVIRAPVSGIVRDGLPIGSLLVAGDQIAYVGEVRVTAKFDGALRGLLHDGLEVEEGLKIGDLDPRSEREYCFTVSDKALAVAGGVLEALSSHGIYSTGSAK
jgi:xanthine dehydrogenase accessory factor